jgi:hypothetical protein
MSRRYPAAVVIKNMASATPGIVIAQLVCEGGQKFAELIDVTTGTPYVPPQRILLYEQHLELVEEESAGSPATYHYHGMVVFP